MSCSLGRGIVSWCSITCLPLACLWSTAVGLGPRATGWCFVSKALVACTGQEATKETNMARRDTSMSSTGPWSPLSSLSFGADLLRMPSIRSDPTYFFFFNQTPVTPYCTEPCTPYHRRAIARGRPPVPYLTSKQLIDAGLSVPCPGQPILIYFFLNSPISLLKSTCGGVTTLCCISLPPHAGFIRSSSGSPPSLPVRRRQHPLIEERQTSPLTRHPLLLLVAFFPTRLLSKILHGHRLLPSPPALSIRHHVLPHEADHSGHPSRHISESHPF